MSPVPRPSTQHSDARSLAAIAVGDRQALESLYLAYHRRLARFLSRFTSQYETVEEIINDTFLIVWTGAREFRHASQVSTWIFGIAYRTTLKALRRQKQHALEDPLDACGEPGSDPSELADVRDWLSQGLARLSAEQRLTVELAYHMGYSVEEIAEITAVPVGTVKARMFHAREKLRRHLPELRGYGPDEE
jgi:RNA polymerase sigma-70 factor (ECF subfamily)